MSRMVAFLKQLRKELALLGTSVRHILNKKNVQMCVFACFKIKSCQFGEVITDGRLRQGVALSLREEQ